MPHIKHDHEGDFKGYAWCGVKIWSHDWVFQNLDHAAYSSAAQDSVEVCEACARMAAKALTWQHDSKEVVQLDLPRLAAT